jgi:dihydroorotate dehydrogenase electron transfer subunit
MLPKAMRIVEIRKENRQTKTFVLDGALAATPGQFVMAWLPGVDEKPFSLADASPVTLTIAAVGPFSRALHGLAVGERLWVRGPLGRGYVLPDQAGAALLIGGGYGVAPLRFLAEQLLRVGQPVSMIVGARTVEQLLLTQAVLDLGIPLWLTTEDGSAGLRGLVTDAFEPAMCATPDGRVAMVYACGPTGMLQAVAARCAALDVPVQLSWEAHMRCGIGLCGSCEVGSGWLTCLDGPVFPFDPCDCLPDAFLRTQECIR